METRSKSSRSNIWRYFEPIDTKNTKCLLCANVYRNSGNTTNLIDHLKRMHHDEFEKANDLLSKHTKEADENISAVENIKFVERDPIDLVEDERKVIEFIKLETELTTEIVDNGDNNQIMVDNEPEGTTIVTQIDGLINNNDEYQICKIVPLPSARSEVWTYFGFVADDEGNILDKTKVVCKLCQTSFCYSGNTTNFYSHLKSLHSEVQVKSSNKIARIQKRTYSNFTDDLDDPSENTETLDSINGVSKSSSVSNSLPTFDSIPERSRRELICVEDITNYIIDFIISDCRPIDIIQGHGFQRMLRLLAPGYSLPEKHKLELAIRKKYDQIREKKMNSLQPI